MTEEGPFSHGNIETMFSKLLQEAQGKPVVPQATVAFKTVILQPIGENDKREKIYVIPQRLWHSNNTNQAKK
jgi:hypothetical protein